MWLKWLPWRFIVRNVARKRGFLDPIALVSRLGRFAQPSEVAAPVELLRSGAVLHARGLMNSQAIQHNLDWIWPYWVERQFNPLDNSFVPRAFSITHINLTHRNWTAVGFPDSLEWPIVDPRGLVTPMYDGWSLDSWIIGENGQSLFPSQLPSVSQKLSINKNLAVITESQKGDKSLNSRIEVNGESKMPVCQIQLNGYSRTKAWLAVSLRPYNPEGVSFLHDITILKDYKGWKVNNENFVYFDVAPEQYTISSYHQGDVYRQLFSLNNKIHIRCEVGMATAAALFELKPDKSRKITLHVPLKKKQELIPATITKQSASQKWEESLQGICHLKIPDEHFQFLYDVALRTLILHSPGEVYPGPFTYRRFWFRDAAFILHAMLSVGLSGRVKRAIDHFPKRQTQFGYFRSQEGEWDSNGEALWIMRRFCELTGKPPPPQWQKAVDIGGLWISRKRLLEKPPSLHAGLLPAGFSAEHLGPNDYYYWDDFWGVTGLKSAGYLLNAYGKKGRVDHFHLEAEKFLLCIENSLAKVSERLGEQGMPASPYRRLDAGAIGSLVAGYPLKLWSANDPRLIQTAEFLLRNCFVKGGFFQDMTHSGINPYLTLHIAQVLLRAGDLRYFDLMMAVAQLASPTGQWPEAVHPITGGGCMGDGQHVWAAAEWILMMRNCFIHEEEQEQRLILCSGIPRRWLTKEVNLLFGPAPTSFGEVRIAINPGEDKINVEWHGRWFAEEPRIEIQFPGLPKFIAEPGQTSAQLQNGDL